MSQNGTVGPEVEINGSWHIPHATNSQKSNEDCGADAFDMVTRIRTVRDHVTTLLLSSSPIEQEVMSTIPPTSTHSISTRHWSLEGLLKISDNFRLVARVPLSVAKSSLVDLDKPGDPLIIEGLHEHPAWPKDMFNVDWLSHYGPKGVPRLA